MVLQTELACRCPGFGHSCLVDEEHARQVARLSLDIFDSLSCAFTLGDRERRLLEAAALLII